MKNNKKNRLSLSKIKIAALEDVNKVKGGSWTQRGSNNSCRINCRGNSGRYRR